MKDRLSGQRLLQPDDRVRLDVGRRADDVQIGDVSWAGNDDGIESVLAHGRLRIQISRQKVALADLPALAERHSAEEESGLAVADL